MLPLSRYRRCVRLPLLAALAALARLGHAQGSVGNGPELPGVVVQATAIAGNGIDVDKIPGNVQTLDASDLTRSGDATLARALGSQLGSVNINDNLDDPFQPDILYRGFAASPVLGTPQGLAVYQNGVRINEAFGDTVNWDLFPDLAIDRVSIVSANPVYGLNALGGAVTVSMKNGFSYHGADLELSGGSFGDRGVAAQFGANTPNLGIYVAGRAQDLNGWRLFSTDSVRQLYASVGARGEHGSLDVDFTTADNHLNGQSATPVQELALSRGLIFTGPQANADRLDFLTVNGSLKVTESWSLQSVLYYRRFRQEVANGNTSNYVACTNSPGLLCQPDGLTPLTNPAGAALPDITDGGTRTIGENDFESVRTDGRGAAFQASNDQPLAGHDNQLTAGATLDDASVLFQSGTQVGVLNPDLLVTPSALIVDTSEASAGTAFRATPVALRSLNKDYGFYATDTFDVTPLASVTASGRYNVAYIDLKDELGANLTGNNRYSHFNPGIGATYKVLPALTAYAGYSLNTRAPTASEIECSDPSKPCLLPSNLAGDPPTLRQVIAHTTELGLRGRRSGPAGGELSWNASVFRTRLHDDIYGIATSVSQGFFENIGDTRRQGFEAGINHRSERWSTYANYSYVEATFESALTVPSPSNPQQDSNGDIRVRPGDRLPGIPRHRLKVGADFKPSPAWVIGASVNVVSSQVYFGDESNQIAPLPGYRVVGLHASWQAAPHCQMFASVNNLFNAKYSSYGILSDPTGVGAPGIPADGVTNGPGVDNRFQSPAPPFAVTAGVRVTF